ncbi:MAG: hypothetical protein AUG54_03370 [Ktedonobacter sp. 13_1_20CM_4_53_7]|nr:MAG: hypothetical protein AUG54_03370 [Ktedonobacter sp. 13_1_20CM_4_53_7]
MENQQFENQEWQTPQQHYVNTDPREQQGQQGQQGYYPQSMYVDPREKIQPAPRRRRPWLWIVAAIVIIALLAGGIQSGLRNFVNTSSETHTYAVSAMPRLVINDNTGTVTIHTGARTRMRASCLSVITSISMLLSPPMPTWMSTWIQVRLMLPV